MAGWHHWLDGREFEWTPGVGDGQGGLVCCDSWGRKESDMTERLNWTEGKIKIIILDQDLRSNLLHSCNSSKISISETLPRNSDYGLSREDGVYLLFTVPWIIVDQVGKPVSKYKVTAVSKKPSPWVRGGQRCGECGCPFCSSLPLQWKDMVNGLLNACRGFIQTPRICTFCSSF